MIDISKKSEAYIEKVFSQYEFMDGVLPKKLRGRTVIHLYPTIDTKNDENDDLLGFEDALLFDVRIYNNKKKYVIYGRDQIEINTPDSRIRIFKDGSTMIILDGEIELEVFQSLEIHGRKYD